jgi:prephenate dehydrogenase
MPLTRLAIIGPGLLGGSIALAMCERRPEVAISVWARRAEALKAIRQLVPAAFTSSDLREVVAGADLVVLCVPIGAMPDLASEMEPFLKPGALVTDVGSVKVPVVRALPPLLPRAQFVGSHPMAGSDQSGLSAARADLFQDAVCIVTVDADSKPEPQREACAFWRGLGCQVRTLTAAEHDEIVAFVSHLPHLAAAALVNMVVEQMPEALGYCGSGFRDSTRVAAGPAAMWTEIALANRGAIARAAEAMVEKLREVARLLDANDPDSMTRFLSAAQAERERLRK